ncbi:MAG TPA: 3-hydroxyacyl-ACP dehydratase FabZ [Candidatus Goldiibacteriota bacterium]|nr:3-hydroxyacyl-ACP dehydratase FabZ [Candidatus Goldiibacteriota bacterium]
MMDVRKIQELLPHRFPFLLVDRVLEMKEGESITALKNVTMNEWFFQGHYPGMPVMPGVLIVEAMAQSGGILLMNMLKGQEGKAIYFMTINNVKFRKPVVPGDTLTFKVNITKLKGTIGQIHGEAFVGNEKAAEADMMAMIADK